MNDRVLVAKMIAYIEQNLEGALSAEDIALRSGYSQNRFREKFFNVTGDTPSGYLRKRRLTESAKEILSGARIVDVALKYGYSSQDNFTTAFRSFFGVPPIELSRIEGKYRRFIRKMREAYTIMEIANLKQGPLNTTLMGCLKGAMDYFDLDVSAPMLFGLTGHAFLVNIHRNLEPSGPYVWKKDRFLRLLDGIGIRAGAQYEVTRAVSEAERLGVEEKLRAHLDSGEIIMLTYLEHQLVAGYDENGFTFLQPWNGMAASEIKALSFGTWKECLDAEGWVGFAVLSPSRPERNFPRELKSALEFAVELHNAPEAHEIEGYRIGARAYETWLECIRKGLGSTHGHWWNAQVWAECKRFAGEFFAEVPELIGGVDAPCAELSTAYREISDMLMKAGDKELDPTVQEKLVRRSAERERDAVEGIGRLLTLVS